MKLEKPDLSTSFTTHLNAFDHLEDAVSRLNGRYDIHQTDVVDHGIKIVIVARREADVVKSILNDFCITTSRDPARTMESHEVVEKGEFLPEFQNNFAFLKQIDLKCRSVDLRKVQDTKKGEFNQERLDKVRSGGGKNACAATALGAALHRIQPNVDPLNTLAVDVIYKNISDDYDEKGPSSPHKIVLEAKKHNCQATLIESRGRIFGTLLASFGRMFQRWKQYNSDNAQARIVPNTRGLQRSDFDHDTSVIIIVMPASMSGPGHAMLAYRKDSDYFIMEPATGKAEKFENFEKWAGINRGFFPS